MHRRLSAFSLVELSIVLVILGLLVGGVLAGQSLIRASELRSVGTEYSRYVTAVNAFRDKYFALPGDMANATSVWGIAGGTTGNDTTCRDTASTDARTCNGNADGFINTGTGSREMFRFWQHLANAGLIEGSYTGRHDGADGLSATANNSPKPKLGGSSIWFSFYHGTVAAGAGNAFQGNYGNTLELAGISGSNPYLSVVKPEEAWNGHQDGRR